MVDFIRLLPHHIQLIIIIALSPNDVITIPQVCKKWNSLFTPQLCKVDFGISFETEYSWNKLFYICQSISKKHTLHDYICPHLDDIDIPSLTQKV